MPPVAGLGAFRGGGETVLVKSEGEGIDKVERSLVTKDNRYGPLAEGFARPGLS